VVLENDAFRRNALIVVVVIVVVFSVGVDVVVVVAEAEQELNVVRRIQNVEDVRNVDVVKLTVGVELENRSFN